MEYCLVPRNLAEKLYQKNHQDDNEMKGGSPSKKRVKVKPRNRCKIPLIKIPNRGEYMNPDLENLLDLKFPPTSVRYAKALLSLFKNKSHIKWDEMGNLITPIDGYNLVDMIKKMVQEKSLLELNELPFYKMLTTTASIPLELIKNNQVRGQLLGVPVKTKKKKNESGYASWQPY